MQCEFAIGQRDVKSVEKCVPRRVRLASGEHVACAAQGIRGNGHALYGRFQLIELFECHGKSPFYVKWRRRQPRIAAVRRGGAFKSRALNCAEQMIVFDLAQDSAAICALMVAMLLSPVCMVLTKSRNVVINSVACN